MAVNHNKARPTDKVAEVVDPFTVVVAELVPEIDRREVAELFANLEVADVVMEGRAVNG